MSKLENKLRPVEKVDLRNTVMALSIFRCDYEIRPQTGDFDRRQAYVVAETAEHAAGLIKSTIDRGVQFVWESFPYKICDVHSITPSVERELFLKLKEKYEGPSKISKAKKVMR